jgi:hypothetical protein
MDATRLKASLHAAAGLTVMELLVCIVLLSLLVTLASTSARRLDGDVRYAAALKDMKAIQTALVEQVHPDLGYIPCGIDATSSDQRRELETLFVPLYPYMERSEIQVMLGALDCLDDGYISEYDRIQSAGWRGPYMNASNGTVDATYFDPISFPAKDGSHVYLDALLTPWAQECEAKAEEAEEASNFDLAKEYRKGKYYQIFLPQLTYTYPEDWINQQYVASWVTPTCEIPRKGSYIVSRGADCLPPDAPEGDLAAILTCIAHIKENALSDKNCGKISSGYAQAGSMANLRKCVKDQLEDQFHLCFNDEEAVPLEKRLSITNPQSPFYIDIGDDLVVSLAGKVVRSPLD